MAEQDSTSSRRQVAFKVGVSDLLDNRYVKEDGWLPNYVAVGGRKVSRVNLLGVIVSVDSQDGQSGVQNYILDDGSGRIALRFFESARRLSVGDIVTVVGRPREFGADKYIVPEIVRTVDDPGWVKVRKAELALENHLMFKDDGKSAVAGGISVEDEDLSEESSPIGIVLDTIRRLDDGMGVGFEDVAVKSGVDGVDGCVKRLLEQGEIFEVRPGRYKVLE